MQNGEKQELNIKKSVFYQCGLIKNNLKTQISHKIRKWRCVQNALSRPEDGSWHILLRLDGYGGQEQDCPHFSAVARYEDACRGSADRFWCYNKIQQLPLSRHEQGKACGMPQSEVSGKSTVTAECEARAARRLSRRRREIFWRKAAAGRFLWDSWLMFHYLSSSIFIFLPTT